MSGKINLNVSGGNVAVGSVSQGDRNTVTGSASLSIVIERQYDEARSNISRLADQLGRPTAEREATLAHLQALQANATAASPKVEESAGILKDVRDNFSWAYPVFKDFAKLAWPALLALIGS